MTQDLLVFEIWAPYAVFRRPETTTTALTFSIIPRSAAEGLVGAILGLQFDETPQRLRKSRIAVALRSPVSKLPFSATYTDTKEIWPKIGVTLRPARKSGSPKSKRQVMLRTRVKMEFLRAPRYRIYFDDSKDTKDILEDRLRNHETAFTPYLGSSSMLANFAYIGRFNYAHIELTNPASVSSVVPFFKQIPKISLEQDVTFAVEQGLPIHMTSQRESVGTYDAVYNPSGEQLIIMGIEAERIEMNERDEIVAFLPTEVAPR
jgi:CRISPR-associated protein Cas5h